MDIFAYRDNLVRDYRAYEIQTGVRFERRDGVASSRSASLTVLEWMLPKVLELTYTSWDLQPFARDCGFDAPPFVWDEDRRFQLRCELDAAFFHLYGLNQDEAAYVMDTFDKVAANDPRRYGFHRTKCTILNIFQSLHSTAARSLSS